MDTLLRLSEVEMFSEPFHYAVSPEALDPDVCRTVLTWFETEAPWRLVEADFYEQFEFSLWDIQMPEKLSFLRERPFLRAITTKIASLFQVALSERVDITAHQLVPGQRIRLHNDFIPGYETHRLLIQLNQGWDVANGGLLMFFNSADAADIHKIFLPLHNSAVVFAISARSYHAVTPLSGGERFTLVYSFYEKPG